MRDVPKFMMSEFFYHKGDVQALKPEAPEELKREFEEYYNLECSIEDDYPELSVPYHTWDGKIVDRLEFKEIRNAYRELEWGPGVYI